MAGLDIPSKLRRALGGGKVIPQEQIAQKLTAFDKDKDGALTREELAEAFVAFGCGGPWFCNIMARGVWSFCEMVVPPPVQWVKISLLAPAIHTFMQAQPRKAKRIAITPAGAYGWEPLKYLDGTPVDPGASWEVPELPSVYGDLPPALGTPRPAHLQPEPEPAAAKAAPGPAPRAAPSSAPRAPQAPAGRAPTNTAGRPAAGPAPARPAPAGGAPRRPGPRR